MAPSNKSRVQEAVDRLERLIKEENRQRHAGRRKIKLSAKTLKTLMVLSLEKEEDGASDVDVFGPLNTMVENLPQILNPGGSGECVIAVLNTTSAFVSVGPGGELPGCVMSLLANILGQLSNGNTAISDIKSALAEYRFDDITDKAAGVLYVYEEYIARMSPLQSDLVKTELDRLQECRMKGAELIGEISSYISRESMNVNSQEGAERILALVEIFCGLSLNRELMLQQLYSLSPSDSLKNQIEEFRNSCRLMLKCLHQPSLDQALVCTCYTPEAHPTIHLYLRHVNADTVGRNYNDTTDYHILDNSGKLLLNIMSQAQIGKPPKDEKDSRLRLELVGNLFCRIKSNDDHYLGKLGVHVEGDIPDMVFKPTDWLIDDSFNFRLIEINSGNEARYLISQKYAPDLFIRAGSWYEDDVMHHKGKPDSSHLWKITRCTSPCQFCKPDSSNCAVS